MIILTISSLSSIDSNVKNVCLCANCGCTQCESCYINLLILNQSAINSEENSCLRLVNSFRFSIKNKQMISIFLQNLVLFIHKKYIVIYLKGFLCLSSRLTFLFTTFNWYF